MAGHVHRYRATCSWSGSTGVGYDAYVRDHGGAVPPAMDMRMVASLALCPVICSGVELARRMFGCNW